MSKKILCRLAASISLMFVPTSLLWMMLMLPDCREDTPRYFWHLFTHLAANYVNMFASFPALIALLTAAGIWLLVRFLRKPSWCDAALLFTVFFFIGPLGKWGIALIFALLIAEPSVMLLFMVGTALLLAAVIIQPAWNAAALLGISLAILLTPCNGNGLFFQEIVRTSPVAASTLAIIPFWLLAGRRFIKMTP